ncbi:MAG: hypothetical protein CMB80_08800 [Flammeovirgaceae bacterium]|nr:hypothetical protein [Flammeovirgaceae bacterium]|tara:strand:+ start:71 stop:397 length:327 start_codon:yes stop_codon:yes gene_type:complete
MELKRIISEEVMNLVEAEEDPTAIKRTSIGTGQRKKAALGRIASTDKEFSGMEKGIVNQVEEYFTKLASLPGVDLGQHTAILKRVMKALESAVGKKHREQPQTQGDKQ